MKCGNQYTVGIPRVGASELNGENIKYLTTIKYNAHNI